MTTTSEQDVKPGDPAALLRGVDCVTVPVPDLDSGLAFYRDTLGHQLLWRNDELGQAALRLPESRTELVLTTRADYAPGWLVDSVDRAAEAISEAGGSVITPPEDIPVGRLAVVSDPFGTVLVLVDLSRGTYATDAAGTVTGTTAPSTASSGGVTARPTFTGSDELQGAEFVDADLRGGRFVRADLSGVVMRGVDVAGMDVDAPWLLDGGSTLLVNGVDVAPLVDAELDRRFPGRAERRASDPQGLCAAWAKLELAWAATLDRVAAMRPGTVDVSVGGEWSFAQTLRHLVLATDMWLGRAVLGGERPFHPIGVPHAEYEADGHDLSHFTTVPPTYGDVLDVRAGRVAMVRDFLAAVTPELLASPRPNPHDPTHQETVLSCLHTILEEEWEHHRYAVRDLDTLEAAPPVH